MSAGRFGSPAAFWSRPYEALATASGLPWRTLSGVHDAAARVLDPVLRELNESL